MPLSNFAPLYTIAVSCAPVGASKHQIWEANRVHLPVFIDCDDYHEAESLIAHFGDEAGLEAANRADQSRARGNHLHYCKWRQVERLCVLMSIDIAIGTVH
jgi:hypothetical protein